MSESEKAEDIHKSSSANPTELLFEVIGKGSQWSVCRDSVSGGAFETRLAAFEDVYTAATEAIKQGFGVCIVVPAAAFNTDVEVTSAASLASN